MVRMCAYAHVDVPFNFWIDQLILYNLVWTLCHWRSPLLQFPTVSNNSMLDVQTNEVDAMLVTHHLHHQWCAEIYLWKICVFVVVIFLSVEYKITKYEHFFVYLVWWWLLLNHIATHYVSNIIWKLANTYIMRVWNMGIISMRDRTEYDLSNKTFTKSKQNK